MGKNEGKAAASTAPAGIDMVALRAQADAILKAEEAKLLEAMLAEGRAQRDTSALMAKAVASVAGEPVGLDHNGIPEVYSWITVQPGNNKKDLSYITPGVNGHILQLQRGVKVPLPNAYVHVLENAMTEITESSMNEFTTRPAQRYSFSNHGPCSKAEYLAFREAHKTVHKQLS